MKMKKWLKWVLIVLAVPIVIFGFIRGFIGVPSQPVTAPPAGGKIKGYWSSESSAAFSELSDAQEMKRIGINTITFSAMLSHDQEGKVSEISGSESYVKRTIGKAHKAGIRVMLETTPMNAGAVSPKVASPKLFQDEMTKMALKYAKIAEDYNVEFFAPIVEPGHHMTDEQADQWLQELLPKLRQVYQGKIMWKKQATDLETPKPWNRDHTLTLGFKLDQGELRLQLKQVLEQGIALRVNPNAVWLEEHSKQGNGFSEMKNVSLKAGYHELGVVIKENSVVIFIDGAEIMNKQDDSGPAGGYTVNGPARFNKLAIADSAGKILFKEKFENLNSWSAKSGMALEGGEIVIPDGSEAKLIHDINFSGFDYIAIDTFHRGRAMTIDEYINFLKYYIQKTNDQAKSDGVPKVILAEFGGSLKENIGWKDADERAKIPLTEDELAETTRRVLELAEDKVDGYIYNGWDIEKQGINHLPKVKKVIQDWYLAH